MKKKELESKIQVLRNITHILEERIDGLKTLMNDMYKYIFENIPDAMFVLKPKFTEDWRPLKYVD